MSWRAVVPTGLLLIFPVVSVVLFLLLPADQQMQLALDHREPRWYQFVTAVVIHRDAPHLRANVVGYAFAYLAWVQLIRLGGQAARGRKIAAIALVVGPVATMLLSLLAYDAVSAVNVSLDRGMSGMVGLMTGLLMYEIVLIALRAAGGRIGAGLTGGYILVMLLTLQTVNGRVAPIIGWGGVATLIVGGGGMLLVWGRERLQAWASVHPELFYTLLVAVPWSVFLFVGLLPASMEGPAGMTNIVAHGGGIILGMVLGQVVQSAQVPIPAEVNSVGS
jgi:hypothetical protein